MADITVTEANVEPSDSATIGSGTAGAAITKGQPVYLASSNKLLPCDNDFEASAKAVGIAVNNAADNQPIQYVSSGIMDVGATLGTGVCYVVSSTAGGIAPAADLATGDYTCILGLCKEQTDELDVNIFFVPKARL